MGIFNWKKQDTVNSGSGDVISYIPYVADGESIKALLKEQQVNPGFKGEVRDKKIKFPTELGVEHPISFAMMEGLYRKYGIVTGAVDKYIDFIVGPGFFVTAEEQDNGDKAVKIINDFMRDVNFDTLLREWLKEGLLKGNGMLEMGGKEDEAPKGMKTLNANWMFVERDDKGVVEGYNQFVGGFDKFSTNKSKVNHFKPHQIAHLKINIVGDDAYGLGIISPAVVFIDKLIQNQKDLHMLMSRKANAPLQVKLGGVVGGKYFKPNPADVTRFGKDLEWLNNKHEWTTDGLTDMKVVDFGNIGEKFNEVLNHDLDMIMFTIQIPEVLMGKAVNLATAPVQMDAFERRIKSLQQQAEKVIENDIFRRVLQANGLDVHVEFNWGKLSTLERDNRLAKLTVLIGNVETSRSLKKLAERDIVRLLEFDEAEFEDLSEEEEKEREAERKQPLVPGQNAQPPGRTQSMNPHILEACAHFEDNGKMDHTLQEWLGFNYKDYISQIDKYIDSYDFGPLAAKNALEVQAGLLSVTQIKALKSVMKNGFKNGKSLNEMAAEIDKRVKLSDLFKIEDGKLGKKLRGKEVRAMGIIRTETTKVANEGAKKQFKEGGVTHIRWVSSFGNRTCVQCEALNGEVFPIDEHPDIPLHQMCRCTLVPVTE